MIYNKEALTPSFNSRVGMSFAQKKPMNLQASILSEDRMITTSINGNTETTRQGSKGDYLITGTKGEQYTMTPNEFDKRYTYNSDKNLATTKPVIITYRVTNKPMTMTTNWGETMNLPAKSAIVYEKGKPSYGIHPEAFKNTYKPLQKLKKANTLKVKKY